MVSMRSVPLTYSELASSIDAGAYPSERTWIDFKRRLYPENPADREGRAKVSLELAKDLASMAVFGGYLVYGVAEDKTNHLFTVDPMSLPVGIHETIDTIARDRITPSLFVTPHLVSDPADSTRGFLVVEIPPSPEAPHMVESVYWGRSETGKVRLTDAEVERLILARGRRVECLHEAMLATVGADPAPSAQDCHFYFTAVPTTGWPDMFVDYARDRQSRRRLFQISNRLVNEIARESNGQERPAIAYDNMISDWRSQKVAAGWIATRTSWATSGGRAVGVDDNGTIRYVDLGASGNFSVGITITFVRELDTLFGTWDMLRFVAALSDETGYRGTWLFGVSFENIRGHTSQVNNPALGFIGGTDTAWETAAYSQTTRATALEVREKPTLIAGRLLRQLLRGLGTEALLEQPPFKL